jgi:hypothetical protein
MVRAEMGYTKMAQGTIESSPGQIQKTRRQRLKGVKQNQPGSTKKPRIIVPPPQSARIMQRYVSGDSIREIAREERRDRATITKIVRSGEMNAVVQKMRERYYALGFDALDAVEHTLKVRKDGGLGRQVLTDIGVIPSPEERYAIASQPDKATLTPFEIAVAEDENGQINRVAYGMACAMEESARCFGTFLPIADEQRRLRRVAKVADEIAEGRFSQICMNDSAEENRIRQLAEKTVRREATQRFLPPRRAQRALPHKNQTAMVRQLSSRN